MKITNISAYPVELPLISYEDGGLGPYITSHGEEGAARSVIVKVETTGGYVGWGEIHLVLSPHIMKVIIEDEFGQKVVGMDPFDIRKILSRLRQDFSTQYFDAPAFAAGVELACWDIAGKATNQAVNRLFGGAIKNRIPACYCLGIVGPDRIAERANKIIGEGYRTVKLKAGLDLDEDVERVRAVRETVGNRLNIRVDANQSFNLLEALEFTRKVEEYDLEYLEQPIPVNNLDGFTSLRSRTKTPIAINEDCYIENNIYDAVSRNSIDAAVIDYEPLGGLIRLIEVNGLANMAGLELAHHCGFDLGIKTAAILHGTSCLNAFSYSMDTIYFSLKDDVLKDRLDIVEGSFSVPDKPGLGVEVDMDKIEKYSLLSD